MLDIQFIRDNRGKVEKASQSKNLAVDINHLLELDTQARELRMQSDELRRRRNKLAEAAAGSQPSPEKIEEGKSLKQQIGELEEKLKEVEAPFSEILSSIPNIPWEDVPVGASENDNVVVRTWGDKTQFDFQPRSHWQIGEAADWIDKERAAKIAGARFAYIKGGLVRLQFAIINFVLDTVTNTEVIQKLIDENQLHISSKSFVPVLPPAMLKTTVFEAMDRLEPADDRYKVGEEDDDLWLQGSAEHTLGPMYKDEVLEKDILPIRLIGFSTSFRREAGSYGKDMEGLIRLHQFDKLEMEVFSDANTGIDEHKLLIAIQEYMMQQLKLPYQLLMKCTADIGKPNARGVDIEVWFPSQNRYRETHTADYMTDYQARRLHTKVKSETGNEFVHTNDATAFALGRIMAAIIENYQDNEGNVFIPDVLKPYMKNQDKI